MKLPSVLRLSPQWTPYVLISPFLILFAVFGLFPLLFSLYLAFQTWEPTSGLGAMTFVGFDNYAFALQDEWFWKSLGNTAWLAFASGVPQHVVAIPLAYFIHSSFKRLRNGERRKGRNASAPAMHGTSFRVAKSTAPVC